MSKPDQSKHESAWNAFWRAPSQDALAALLSTDFSSPSRASDDVPALSFGSLALAACADIRPFARDPQSIRLYAHGALGGYDYPASRAHGSGSEASIRCRGVLLAWSKLLAEGPAPSPFEAAIPLEIMLSSDVWNHPEFMESLSSEEPSAGSDLMRSALELASLADPSRQTASGCVEQFVLGATSSNSCLLKARWLTEPDAVGHIDLATPGLDQRPLWQALCEPLDALGRHFCEAILARSTFPDSIFSSDPAWAKKLLAMAAERQCEFSPQSPADRLLSLHAARGHQIASSFAGQPDLLWCACQHLPRFSQNPPSMSIFSSAPSIESSMQSRDAIEGSFARLALQGCEPAAPGPDGRSPLDILRATPGCEPITARLEAIVLSNAAKAPTPPTPTATAAWRL